MINVLLDSLPEEFEGYPINSDFRIGIQLTQLFDDDSMTDQEQFYCAVDLLFGYDGMTECPDPDTLKRGLEWFITGWYTDRIPESDKRKKKKQVPAFDYDIDQWRLYSAFLSQYHIDLNIDDLHYWKFMGLLTTLDECSFTRVIDFRNKKPPANMKNEERQKWNEQKMRYSLAPDLRETEEEKEERERLAAEFLKSVTIHKN